MAYSHELATKHFERHSNSKPRSTSWEKNNCTLMYQHFDQIRNIRKTNVGVGSEHA